MSTLRWATVTALVLTVGGAAAQEGPVEGPYAMRGDRALEVGLAFDPAAARAALPEGLEPVEGATGGVAVYAVETGYALAPYSAGYLWLDVAGHDGPDGSPARYLVRGYYSEGMHRAEDLRTPQIVLGSGTMTEEADGTVRGVAGPEGAVALEVVVRPATEGCATDQSAIAHYVLGAPEALGLMKIPQLFDVCPAEAESVTVTAVEGDDALAGLTPTEVLWAGQARNNFFAFTPLVPLE